MSATAELRRSSAAEAARERRRADGEALLAGTTDGDARLLALLGREAAARALGLSAGLLARLEAGPPAVRRRLAARLCERLSLPREGAAEILATLPAHPVAIAAAAFRFALTLEIAGAPRVLSRGAYEALLARYGAEAGAFAMAKRGRLRGAPDAGRGDAHAETLAAMAPDRLIETLHANDHPLARPIAAILGRPVAPQGAPAPRHATDPARLAVALDALAEGRAIAEALSRPQSHPAADLAADPVAVGGTGAGAPEQGADA